MLHVSPHHQDLWGMIFVLAIMLIGSRWARSGRRDGWRQNVDAMRERAEMRYDEQRAFQDKILAEMKRQTAAAEQQNELLRQLVGQKSATEGDSATA